MSDTALASVAGLRSLRLDGKPLHVDIAAALTDANVSESIEGATTLTLEIADVNLTILRSGLLSQRITVQVDELGFEMAQVRKTGRTIECTFEDIAVAALRRHDSPLKVEAGTTTHVEFARRLVREEPWIKFVVPPWVPVERTKAEIARGSPAETKTTGEGTVNEKTTTTAEEREDTWTALGRIADDRGWRRFMRRGELWYTPETFLALAPAEYRVTESSKAGVDSVDFDVDTGKPIAEGTITARAGRWQIPVGTVIECYDLGPANGKWLVASVDHNLFDLPSTIKIVKPRPTLPEPDAPTSAGDTSAEGDPFSGDADLLGAIDPGNPGGVTDRAASSYGYIWPVIGNVVSPFSKDRNGRPHEGIDIAVVVGTPVLAAKAGTAVFVGTMGGYGNVVDIQHEDGYKTRYGHLSKFQTTRGKVLARGEQFALSGGAPGAPGAGNSRGPHVHFEIRTKNDTPVDPLLHLPSPSGLTRGNRPS
jgi:hypothetical protein